MNKEIEESFRKKFGTAIREEALVKIRAGSDTMLVSEKEMLEFLTTLRISWLRSEIEKLEGMKVIENEKAPVGFYTASIATNATLTSIITRYKEELKELESK